MPLEFILAIAAFLAVIAGFIVYARKAAKKRIATLQQLAAERGYIFLPKDESGQIDTVRRQFASFNRGGGHRITNLLIQQTKVAQFIAFDWQYSTGTGDGRTTHLHTAMLIEYAGGNLPAFAMHPEAKLFHKVANFFGKDDIDFDHHPAFSDAYHLKGQSETAVRALFSREIMDYFVDHKNLRLEGGDTYLLFYKASGLTDAESKKYGRLFAQAEELADLFFRK